MGTLQVKSPLPISVTFNPSTVAGGATSTGTITLNGAAPAGGLSVTVKSGQPGIVTVPGFVVIPAGLKTMTFTASTSKPAVTKQVSVYATYKGYGAVGKLTVTP